MLASVVGAEELAIDSVLLTLVEQVAVPARQEGQIAELSVREGEVVDEGHVLARLDDGLAKLERTGAEIERDHARELASNDIKVRFAKKSRELADAELARAHESLKRYPKSISQTELDRLKLATEKGVLEIEQAEFDFRAAKQTERLRDNAVQLADERLGRHAIRAPLAGMVVELHRHRGEWLKPGESVLRIVRLNPLRAEGFVHVNDLRDSLVGSRVSVKVTPPGKSPSEHEGRIVFVSPEINPVNGLVRIWAEIENAKLTLRPGLRGSMKCDLASAKRAE